MARRQDELRRALARRSGTNPDDWFLVYRARHGMLACLRELARLRGAGSVLTQLATCCTAVDPIVAAGLRPVYGDISAQTLALDPEALPEVSDLRALVDQHSFGYIDQASSQALREVAHTQQALLVEDCAHCVGRLATDAFGAPLADVSFHSFGVEKMLPTYFGGAVWVNPDLSDAQLRDALRAALAALPEPDARLARAMRGYGTQIRVLNHLPHAWARGLRGWLARRGLFEPAIAPAEMAGAVAHEPLAMDAWSCEQVLAPFEELEYTSDLRVCALAAFERALSTLPEVRVSKAVLASGQPLLRLPVNLLTDEQADAAIAAIAGLGLYAVPWYRPLLYPGVSDAAAYGFDGSLDAYPQTAHAAVGALALPCDLTEVQVASVVEALRKVVAG